MSPLAQAIEDYLALRRSLGFKLRDAGICLAKFAAFLEERGAAHITIPLALEWAQQNPSVEPSTCAQRLGHVRSFARHYQANDPQTEIPPPDLLPYHPRRARPYLYSDEEVERLLRGALDLQPVDGLRPWTFHCLFGLLSVAGLRIGEAIRFADRRCRFTGGLVDGSRHEVREVPSGADSSIDPKRCWRSTKHAGHASSQITPLPRTSSSPVEEITWTSAIFTAPSTSCRARWICAVRQPVTGRACMTFGIALRLRPCCNGTARARTSSDACRSCRPTSDMSMSPTLTGISALLRN
jgi:hypothetical protein